MEYISSNLISHFLYFFSFLLLLLHYYTFSARLYAMESRPPRSPTSPKGELACPVVSASELAFFCGGSWCCFFLYEEYMIIPLMTALPVPQSIDGGIVGQLLNSRKEFSRSLAHGFLINEQFLSSMSDIFRHYLVERLKSSTKRIRIKRKVHGH